MARGPFDAMTREEYPMELILKGPVLAPGTSEDACALGTNCATFVRLFFTPPGTDDPSESLAVCRP